MGLGLSRLVGQGGSRRGLACRDADGGQVAVAGDAGPLCTGPVGSTGRRGSRPLRSRIKRRRYWGWGCRRYRWKQRGKERQKGLYWEFIQKLEGVRARADSGISKCLPLDIWPISVHYLFPRRVPSGSGRAFCRGHATRRLTRERPRRGGGKRVGSAVHVHRKLGVRVASKGCLQIIARVVFVSTKAHRVLDAA